MCVSECERMCWATLGYVSECIKAFGVQIGEMRVGDDVCG